MELNIGAVRVRWNLWKEERYTVRRVQDIKIRYKRCGKREKAPERSLDLLPLYAGYNILLRRPTNPVEITGLTKASLCRWQ